MDETGKGEKIYARKYDSQHKRNKDSRTQETVINDRERRCVAGKREGKGRREGGRERWRGRRRVGMEKKGRRKSGK